MQPTIKKAESELKKNNKKVSIDLKKLGADNTKTAIGEAKGDDDAMKAAFPNVAAGASLKAFPKASLAQKTQKKKVIKLTKTVQKPVSMNQKEEEMSKEDQEE
jgi:hypothetical protein